jgi:hypothetical protein
MGRTDPYAAQWSCRSCPSKASFEVRPWASHALKGRGANVVAAFALADLLSRRGLECTCETVVAWAREA